LSIFAPLKALCIENNQKNFDDNKIYGKKYDLTILLNILNDKENEH
tara:strand:- start:406 stop:543 length:138 start_codon:yes stop_codon:yes gene_type:complete